MRERKRSIKNEPDFDRSIDCRRSLERRRWKVALERALVSRGRSQDCRVFSLILTRQLWSGYLVLGRQYELFSTARLDGKEEKGSQQFKLPTVKDACRVASEPQHWNGVEMDTMKIAEMEPS